jgi:hypothetical protein
MAWFERAKSTDPFTARQKVLEAEMTRLQAQLKELAAEPPVSIPPAPAEPTARGSAPFAAPLPPPPTPLANPNGHYNDLGIRKWDFAAAWKKLRHHLQGPTGNNPKLATMLVAGSIHGLRPLRREKRVARNRSIALFVTLLLVLWGIAYVYLGNSR